MLGETLDGRYKLIRLLGQGGMGAVYEAQHTETSQRVAIKVIRSDIVALNDERVRRFQREARVLGAIDTEHIAQVLHTGTDEARKIPYIALEYLNGEDLHALLKRVGRVGSDLALRIVGQACLGLQKAHEAGVLHRDIKPANLFLTVREGGEVRIKLLDFGIAKMRPVSGGESTTGLTHEGAVLGSPLYMSPEQARSMTELDERADIWSLGVVLYRALAGRAPHEHIATMGGLIFAICVEPPAPIQSIAPWVPSKVAKLVHRALARKREKRFQSAAEMLAAIQALVPGGLSIRHEELLSLTPAEPLPAMRPTEPSTQTDTVGLLTSMTEGLTDFGGSLGRERRARWWRAPWRGRAALALALGAVGVCGLVALTSRTQKVEAERLVSLQPALRGALGSAHGARPAAEERGQPPPAEGVAKERGSSSPGAALEPSSAARPREAHDAPGKRQPGPAPERAAPLGSAGASRAAPNGAASAARAEAPRPAPTSTATTAADPMLPGEFQ